ncbi:MAG: hypothetical protein M1549_02955 [Candidatus Dependentiae bacterium]|nr:hypothetical protein [Candidatus Dependentiae bacterium]
MNRRFYTDRAAITAAFEQTIDHFGTWFFATFVECIAIAMRIAAGVFLVGMAAQSFFGPSLNYPLFHTPIFDLSGFTSSVYILLIMLGCCVVFELLGGIIDMGMTRIALDLSEGRASSFKQLFSCVRLAGKQFFATVLYLGLVLIGLVLFIVPGIVFAVRLGFYSAILVETGCGSVAALRESSRLTAGQMAPLLTTSALMLILVSPFLGGSCPMVRWTLFFIVPFLLLVKIHIYRSLVAAKRG